MATMQTARCSPCFLEKIHQLGRRLLLFMWPVRPWASCLMLLHWQLKWAFIRRSCACWHKQTPLHSTRGDQGAAGLETGLNAAQQQVLNRGRAGWRRGSRWLTSGPTTDQPRWLPPGFILRCSFLVYALRNQAVGKIQNTEIGCFLIPLEDPSKALGGLSVNPHNGHSDYFIIQMGHPNFSPVQFHKPFGSLGPNCPSFWWQLLRFGLKKPVGPLLLYTPTLKKKTPKERHDGPIRASDVKEKCSGGGWGASLLEGGWAFIQFNTLKCVYFFKVPDWFEP